MPESHTSIRTANSPWGDGPTVLFDELHYDHILKEAEKLGLKTTGQIFTLGSMENRVYEVVGETTSWIMKFYRPGRWSFDQLKEEHFFSHQAMDREIPVLAPLIFEGHSLFKTMINSKEYFFCVFPKKMGRALDELNPEWSERLGRILGRLHLLGQSQPYIHRVSLTADLFIKKASRAVKEFLEGINLPSDLIQDYELITHKLFSYAATQLQSLPTQRLHGDCHAGNMINRDGEIFLIDFDDTLMGPKVQDIWMALGRDFKAGDSYASLVKEKFILGYEEFLPYPFEEEKALKALRLCRQINYHAWVSKRLDDGAFRDLFAHYKNENFWRKEIADLKNEIEDQDSQENFSSIPIDDDGEVNGNC